MVGGSIEGVEAVELGLNFRAVGHGEADFAKNPAQLLANQRQRMVGASRQIRTRKGRIDCRPELSGKFGGLDPTKGSVKKGLNLSFRLVDQFPHCGALFLWHGAHLLHDRSEFAIRAHVAGFGGLKFRTGSRGP